MSAEGLLERARSCPYTVAGLRELGRALGEDDAEIDRLLGAAVGERDSLAFTHLLLAALDAGRVIDARHLNGGLQLLPGNGVLLTAAQRLSGNLAQALVDAVRSQRHRLSRASLALALAARWSKAHGCELPEGFLAEARSLARHASGDDTFVHMLDVAQTVDDDGLWHAAARFDNQVARQAARSLFERSQEAIRGDFLVFAPGEPGDEEAMLSGYTVRRAVARVGRNDPCRCGSGRKYKRCCAERDQERLRDSSEIPGVTRREIQRDVGRYLTRERLAELPPYELVRLVSQPVAEDLRQSLLSRLIAYDELEAVARFLETVGVPEGLDDFLIEAMQRAAERGDAPILRRLAALRGGRLDDLPSGSLIANFVLEKPNREALDRIEAVALAAVDSDDAIDLAYSLLRLSPALGIGFARGVLGEAEGLDAEVLLDVLLEARDRLGLPPEDRVEAAVWERLLGDEAGDFRVPPPRRRSLEPNDEDEESEEAAAAARARAELLARTEEVRRLREETTRLGRELAQAQIQAALPPSPPPARGGPHAGDENDAVAAELKRRVHALKEELKQRHDERNQLRRELERQRRAVARVSPPPAAEALALASAAAESEEDDHLLAAGSVLENQPVRVPSFPSGFHAHLRQLPTAVARAALARIGGLAAGEAVAFHGARRLRIDREIWRLRIGAHHRLLVALRPDAIEVLALVARQDLDRTVKGLAQRPRAPER